MEIIWHKILWRRNQLELSIGFVKDQHPALMGEGTNDEEALSVDLILKNIKIWSCVGYGPQQNDLIEKKNAFWEFLDDEVFAAKKAISGLAVE